MLKKGMTINDAAHEWVREFNCIDLNMVAKLMQYEPDDWEEVTELAVFNRVFVYSEGESGEVTMRHGDIFTVKLDTGETVEVDRTDIELELDTVLPMWGSMWSFDDWTDNYWLENKGGIQLMSDCGFRIYHSEEFGYFFGVDGAGYDFYESHWIPLYEARGLHWHDE